MASRGWGEQGLRNRDGVAQIKEKALGSRDELARMRDGGGGDREGQKVQCIIREQRWEKKHAGAGMGQHS